MNLGGYEVERFALVDFDGEPMGIVLAKKTWTLGDDRVFTPAPEQEPVLFAGQPLEGDDPAACPLRYDSDTALIKSLTDVVVHGIAHAPKGRAAREFEVEVRVGKRRRVLKVFGPRQAEYRKPARQTKKKTIFTPPVFSDPGPVKRVPVDFTRAYGGIARYGMPDSEDVLDIPCPTNPFGRGYCVQNSAEGLDGLELPQVEDPEALLTPETLVRDIGSPEDLPVPAGLGVFGSSWYPRVAWAGVMPHDVERAREQIREQAASLDPDEDGETIAMLQDFEPPVMAPEFFQAAAPGMTFPLLTGDEAVSLKNLTPEGVLAFNLPGVRPLVTLEQEEGTSPLDAVLDTVVFNVDEMRLVLTYRARCPLSGTGESDAFGQLPVDVEELDVKEYRRRLATQSD